MFTHCESEALTDQLRPVQSGDNVPVFG